VTTLDFDRVAIWIERVQDLYLPPYTFELVAGGRSNLTYVVTDKDQRRFILRHPPLSHVLPTAHDMEREYKIISALYHSKVPVPKPISLCKDTSVTDRPFYIMEFVEGRILRQPSEAENLSVSMRSHISDSLVKTLVDLHLLDVKQVHLQDLGKTEGYLERQLRRWSHQFNNSAAEVGLNYPIIDMAHKRLVALTPPQRYSGIVHGDYRLDNTVIGDDAQVAAVLDWEICTLGDTLADLGMLVVYWSEAEDEVTLLASTTSLPGFYSRSQVVDRYVNLSGRDLSDLPYYVSFSYWKLACILAGVYARYMQGARAGDPSDVTQYKAQISYLGEMSLSRLEDL